MRVLLASLTLALAAPPVDPVERVPAAIERPAYPGVLVSVRTLAIDGLRGLPFDENALLERSVDLAWDANQIPAGFVAPGRGRVARPVALWQIGGPDRAGRVLHGSALTALLREIELWLREGGVADARVELDPRAIARLSTPGSDGLLLVRVRR